MVNTAYASCSDLVAALRQRSVSALELFEAAVVRIEQLDPALNAVVVRDFERARTTALAADRALAAGDRRPLLGVPITVKESFNVAGLPTSWGLPDHRDWQPRADAVAVARLKAAGAVVLGKTNVPYALSDWQSANEIYGRTTNPWNFECTPGGSSGGGAAALAAGLAALELGSDLAGSLRAPAHFCGIFSHRPSFGLISTRGHTPPVVEGAWPFDLAVIGPMARCAADLKLAFELLVNENALRSPTAPSLRSLRGARILVLDHHPLQPTARAICAALDQLAGRLSAVGAIVSCSSSVRPDLALASTLFFQLLKSNHRHPLLMRFLAKAPAVLDVFKQLAAATETLLPDDSTAEPPDWPALKKTRNELEAQWRTVFEKWDVVLCPPMSTLAFHHNDTPPERRTIEIDQKAYRYFDQIAWPSVAIVPGLPATVAPIGSDESGLPIGVQIIGPPHGDRTTIAVAALIEGEFGGFVPPPRYC